MTTNTPEATAVLLDRARGGDDQARNDLMARYLPLLRRWARGRLPSPARGALDTEDLVQVVLVRALGRIDSFRAEREGAFLAYLRTSLLNAVRDEIRSTVRRPRSEPLPLNFPDRGPSPVERAIGRELMERYEAALAELNEIQREAVILRIEFGFSHRDLAAAIGSPSAEAARKMVSRALLKMAGELREAS